MRLSRVTGTVGAAALLVASAAVVVALLPGAASARTATRAAGVPAGRHHRRAAGAGKGGVGIFTEHCGYAKTANIDPILMPGMSDTSMAHDFFGNTAVAADSTSASLAGGPTTCATSADSSAYWTPVLYQNGVPVPPTAALIYWRARGTVAPQVRTMPAGLSMIAGNESATEPQGRNRIEWSCTRGTDRPTSGRLPKPQRFATPPSSCAPDQRLLVTIDFPSCWDGHTLNGADQRNVVYPGKGDVCPADHPVRIPQLVLHAAYPVKGTSGLALSTGKDTTGSVNSEHADFINAFVPGPLAEDVHRCIDLVVRCGRVTGPDATTSPR